jgi:hypothetical protein
VKVPIRRVAHPVGSEKNMQYITSRGFRLPRSSVEFGDSYWFNLWKRKLWPYEEIQVGALLFWYETPSKRMVWKSTIRYVGRFSYGSKSEARKRLISTFGDFDQSQSYFVNAPPDGYCLAYKVTPLVRVDVEKPHNLRFPQEGWLRINAKIATMWLGHVQAVDDDLILDELASADNLWARIRRLNSLLADKSPDVVRSIVERTIRRDTELVRTLKRLCDFRCQFPSCGVRIPKRAGGFYVEVAHVMAVNKGGRSVLGNLLLLCPNHHKEFDYGNLKVTEQTPLLIRGSLNGQDFTIHFPGTEDAE